MVTIKSGHYKAVICNKWDHSIQDPLNKSFGWPDIPGSGSIQTGRTKNWPLLCHLSDWEWLWPRVHGALLTRPYEIKTELEIQTLHWFRSYGNVVMGFWQIRKKKKKRGSNNRAIQSSFIYLLCILYKDGWVPLNSKSFAVVLFSLNWPLGQFNL